MAGLTENEQTVVQLVRRELELLAEIDRLKKLMGRMVMAYRPPVGFRDAWNEAREELGI